MMKKALSILLLLAAAFFGLIACEGSYIDPNAMRTGGGPGGGSISKPTELSNNATYSEAVAKLDEIIAYCNATGSRNISSRAEAESIKATIAALQSYWSYNSSQAIESINNVIRNLQ